MLDTHILVWMMRAPERLRPADYAAIDDAGSGLLVSVISIWEIRTKWLADRRKGRLDEVPSPEEAIAFANANDFAIVPLAADDCAVMLRTPLDHIDPFDEMLLVHAQQLGARLLTRNRKLSHHPLSVPL